MIHHERVVISGAAGIAYTSPAEGLAEYAKVAYTNGQAGGDVTITDEATGAVLLQLTDNNTDKDAPLRKQAMGADGAAIAGVYGRPPLSGRIKVETAQEAANTTVTVDVWWEQGY
jgi:hypothetical protein